MVYGGQVCAVDEVDLIASPGEVLALVGPSGCGKTTLLRLIAGLESPTSGDVRVDPPLRPRSGDAAFVFQQPSLLPWRTATENVMLPLELTASDGSEKRNRAKEVLRQIGLGDALDRFPDQLSGGMKMRVSIARALVTEPKLLLLDEPFAALDDMLRGQLGQLVLKLWQQHGFTVVMVTHNIAEAILLSNRIALMDAGRILDVVVNPLSYPRDEQCRGSAEFGSFYKRISDALRGER